MNHTLQVSILIAGCFVLYIAGGNGVVSSNDGSHYALVRALVDDRSVEISDYKRYTLDVDYARHDGRIYSDRTPGTALLSAPFYLLGRLSLQLFPIEHPDAVSGHFPRKETPYPITRGDRRLQFVTFLQPVALTCLTLLIFYSLLRRLGADHAPSLIAVAALGLGTANLKYATTLFSHATSTFCIVLAVWLAVTARGNSRRRSALIGFVLGYAVLTEYPNAFIILPVCIYHCLSLPGKVRASFARAGALLLGALLPALALGAYHYACFGEVFTTMYKFRPHHAFGRSLGTLFANPLLEGLYQLCLDPYQRGLFVFSPVLLLAVWGFRRFLRERRAEAILFASLFLVVLLTIAAKIENDGGGHGDTRYLSAAMPFLVAGLAFRDRGHNGHGTGQRDPRLSPQPLRGPAGEHDCVPGSQRLLWVLLGLSVALQFSALATFYRWTDPLLETLQRGDVAAIFTDRLFPHYIYGAGALGLAAVGLGVAARFRDRGHNGHGP